MNENYQLLELVSAKVSRWVSGSTALLMVSGFLLGWLAAGPYVHFREGWHLTITSSSAAICLFMVFVLTRAQSKDTMTIQIKLNEVIAALSGANNRLINIETLSENEIAALHKRYEAVAEHIQHQEKDIESIESIVAHEIQEEVEAQAGEENIKTKIS